MGAAADLAAWACALQPTAADRALADRSLRDTIGCAVAGRDHPVAGLAAELSEGGRWASVGHVLDYDDLHMPSTAHISVVCVPAVLAAGGDDRAYLAAAGVMARIGTALGWAHYSAGWHATCTAGAPAAAAGVAIALGLDDERTAIAMALAVPGAGGVQRAFGTDAKSLQVGFAVETGTRAARLAAAGARADPAALDDWLALMGAGPIDLAGPAVPEGLAIKLHPCCYALQRPIAALRHATVDVADVRRIVVRTPAAAVVPLIHARPTTGLEGKFSIEYAIAATLLDGWPGFASFTDEAVQRSSAQDLLARVELELAAGGDGLLDGDLVADLHLADGTVTSVGEVHPPGSPQNPPTADQLAAKLTDCIGGTDVDPAALTWSSGPAVLRAALG